MNNPWNEIQINNHPYILEMDKDIIDAINNSTKCEYRIQTLLFPEPFLGDKNAKIVLLNLNPGYSPDDDNVHSNNLIFREEVIRNLNHQATCPFLFMDKRISQVPGAVWWRSKLRQLISECDEVNIAKNIQCIEYFPYHSKKFKLNRTSKSLPSSFYTCQMVKNAIDRKAIIIIMRNKKAWIEKVPELNGYDNVFELINKRNVTISCGNLPDGVYKKIKLAINS